MSRYIKEVHKCETPEILPSQNHGTVWECDCKLRWVISLSHYTGNFVWSHLEKWKFNEAEDRLLTQEEILDKNRWVFYRYFYDPGLDRIFKGPGAGPRDLLSQMAIQHGMSIMDNRYHLSTWQDDCNRITHLTKLGLLNPYSNHPTKLGHKCIADLLSSTLPINRMESDEKSVS